MTRIEWEEMGKKAGWVDKIKKIVDPSHLTNKEKWEQQQRAKKQDQMHGKKDLAFSDEPKWTPKDSDEQKKKQEKIDSDYEARQRKLMIKDVKGSNETPIVEAKKKKEWNPNPWAVCHTTTDKDKDPEKYERCVMDVKKKQK